MAGERTDANMPLKCRDCGAQWEERFGLPMNLSAFVKKVKGIACPECGGEKIDMLPEGDLYVPDK